MDLTVAKKDLLKLVTRMQGVSERKSTMPILANVLLAVEGPNALRIAATDLYLSVFGRISAEIRKEGSVAIPAKDLFERVKMMPDGPIHIATQDNFTTTLKASGSARRYSLRGMPGEEFPPLPAPAEGDPSLSLEVAALKALLDGTHFSISADMTRAHLNSALFEWSGDIVRMVTTDGHRLSKMEIRIPGRQASATMLIPLKAVQELRRICDEASGHIQITQSGSSAFFHTSGPVEATPVHGGMTFSVKLVEAQFPPYEQVIPKDNDKQIGVPRAAFADALRAVSIAASERTGGVKIGLQSGVMHITSESPDSGEGRDEVAIEYGGPDMSFGFNAKYFLDALGATDAEDITLGLSGEPDPAVIRPRVAPTGASEVQFLAVIMPMRV